MSKTLWNTIKIEVPNEMVNITKKDKVTIKKSLTKTNNISKSNKEPSIKIIPGNVNKPKIISDGKEWNIEELKIRMKKSKDLSKKNEGKELKKKISIDEKFRKFKDENMAFTNERAKGKDKYGRKTTQKQILFDKKTRFGEGLFKRTQPSENFKSNLEIYKKDDGLTMKEIKKLFTIGYDHIKPDNNIKAYNKMIKEFIDFYDLKVKK
jgi:hypothetical protein